MSELISTQDAADLIGISREAVWQAIKRGNIKAQRIGRAWLVSKESAQEYKRQREKRQEKK